MVRGALLIGVDRYPPGLDPLPKVRKDVEIMRRVLKQPQPGFDALVLASDTPLGNIQAAIETFFTNRSGDDHVLFLFAGYILQNGDRDLYFATPATIPDPEGRLIRATTIPASFIRDVMDRSPARHQMVILDAYLRQTFQDQPVAGESRVDLESQLGGANRIILTASATTQHVSEPAELDVWSYCRYLSEGIETGVADADDDGWITPLDLHQYACRCLKIAAPAMQPQIYGDQATMTQRWFPVSVNTPRVNYYKVLADRFETAEIDATSSMVLTGRTLLDSIRHSLGILPQEAAAIESRTLRPIRDYRQRLQTYQERFSSITQGQDVANGQIRQYLKQIQQALCLMDKDTAAIDAFPHVTEQQRQQEQYQRNLAQYEQVLLSTMQQRFPLTEGDRQVLRRWQQVLQLRDEDIAAIEQQLHARMNYQDVFSPFESVGNSLSMPDPPIPSPSPNTTVQSPQPTAPSPISPPFPSPTFAPMEYTPGSGAPMPEAMRPEHMQPEPVVNVSFPGGMPGGGPVSAPEMQPISSPPAPPSIDVAPPMPRQPAMQSHSQSPRKPYVALIIPGLLLAALVGSLVAYWSSTGSNPFNARNNAQIADNPAQQEGRSLSQAASKINDGVKSQTLGFLDEAIDNFNQAIKLTETSCVPASNLKSTDCQVLARAFSNRSYAHFQQQNFARALEDANQAVALDPNLGEARINLANARFKQGEIVQALQDYDQALTLNLSNPLRAGAHNNRGNVLFSQQKLDNALADYNEAIRLNQRYADAYFNRGLTHELLKNPSDAVSDFQQAARFYTEQKSFTLAKEAERRAQALQKQAPDQTPLPPNSVGRQS